MGNLTILHVEDDATDAVIFKEALSRNAGSKEVFAITRVETMGAAIKEVYSNEYSAVLLDLNLPDLRGIDNVKCLRAENPLVPIVVLTSVDSDNWANEVLEAGAQEYLVKGHCTGQILSRVIQSSISRKKIENKLFEQAHYDELTGLPNKLFFRDTLNASLARAKRRKNQEAFFFMDIENFKTINRTFGEDLGNCLLKEVAKRIKDNLRECDFIARYEGDTFAIHLDNENDEKIKSRCMLVAQKIQNFMQDPFELQGSNIRVSVNIAMALYPECGQEFDQIMGNVEVAMHFLKVNNKTKFCFTKNLHDHFMDKDTKTAKK
ncbi:MAG: diguanylate cyclase [Alphaproteobacteria bacterium]|nr:diguanylate cyclase [Alphaproteobacteria bacterium]